MNSIAIIGSGLAAVSAARSLVKQGIKPVILDYGDTLSPELQRVVDDMASRHPDEWPQEDKKRIASNTTIHNKHDLPKKLAFGSDFFYASPKVVFNNKLEKGNPLPPFSLAYGGFGNGWGGASLPSADCDMQSWPIKSKDLAKYYQEILEDMPLSACDDMLSSQFPLHSKTANALKLTPGNESLLSSFKKKADKLEKISAIAGQARLLTQTANSKGGCQYCGFCMSGCVYDSIYKPANHLDSLIKNELVEYRSGILVESLREYDNQVEVFCRDKAQRRFSFIFKRVFLAAGAVGSTHIVLQSKKLYGTGVNLLTTNGFIAPLWRWKREKMDWPDVNTQPGIFLEYKVPSLSEHWVHVQLSTPNELVLQKLNMLDRKNTLFYKAKKYIAEHLYIAQCNMHSNHGVGHTIMLQRDNSLTSTYNDMRSAQYAFIQAKKRLSRIVKHVGCSVVSPMVNSGVKFSSNHLGGSLPMKHNPIEETDTNRYGNPKGWSLIHVIDSSVFPSIPGTTVGLLAMANAKRIVDEVLGF